MDEQRLAELIQYAESAKADDYPFEVTGIDLEIVLEALKRMRSPTENRNSEPT